MTRCGLILAGAALLLASVPVIADERWVVLGGDIAATLAALDSDLNVIARDDTVLYPDGLAALPSVGYLRQLSAESLLAVQPDHVLASAHAGPPEVLEQLDAVGVDMTLIEAPATLAGIAEKVRAVAHYIDQDGAGERLAETLTAQLDQLAALPPLPPARAMFMLQHSGLTPRAAGQQTAAHAALEAVGLTNAFADMQGYHRVSSEALVRQAPDIVIVSTRGLDAMGGQAALWQLPGLALTPAGRARRLVVVDDQALLGFGPRAPQQLLSLYGDVADRLNTTAHRATQPAATDLAE